MKHPPDDRPLTIGDALEQINRALQECLAALGLPRECLDATLLLARHREVEHKLAVGIMNVLESRITKAVQILKQKKDLRNWHRPFLDTR